MRSDVVNIAKQEQFPNVLKAIHLQAFESVFAKCKCQVRTLPSRKLKIFLFRREKRRLHPSLRLHSYDVGDNNPPSDAILSVKTLSL